MTSRQALLLLAGALLVVGVVLGFRSIHTDNVVCGSVFSPSSTDAKIADDADDVAGTLEGATPSSGPTKVAACDSAISDAKPLAYGALGLGFIAVIASFVVPARPEQT